MGCTLRDGQIGGPLAVKSELRIRMNELIRILKKKKLIEKLTSADTDAGIEIYYREKEQISEMLTEIRDYVEFVHQYYDWPFVEGQFEISKDNIMEVYLICIMADVEMEELFRSKYHLTICSLEEPAKKIAEFLKEDQLFYQYTEEELVEMFFS